jgi:hypothetical protein
MKAVVLISTLGAVAAWPGMRHEKLKDQDYIGPACTVGKYSICQLFVVNSKYVLLQVPIIGILSPEIVQTWNNLHHLEFPVIFLMFGPPNLLWTGSFTLSLMMLMHHHIYLFPQHRIMLLMEGRITMTTKVRCCG